MIIAWLILILSIAMLVFYCQTVCQSILRREFEHRYVEQVVRASCLEFPEMKQAIELRGVDRDFKWYQMGLRCDFLTLNYLLRKSSARGGSYSWELRLLMIYFRAVYLWMLVSHALELREARAILRLTEILDYLANVAGQRIYHRSKAPATVESE